MTKPTILMVDGMMAYAADQIAERFETLRLPAAEAEREAFLAEHGARVDGIGNGGGTRIDGAFLDQLPNCKIVAKFGVGYDNVDANAAAERGVVVTHTRGVLDDEVADTAMALLLMAARRLGAAERYLRAGRWEKEGDFPLTPQTVSGRKVGILGLGRIGKTIARRCEGFGLSVSYHNRRKVEDVDFPYYETPKALAAAVDTLIVVIPGGATTRHIVDAEVLKALGSDGIVVNVGRGTTIDETALIEALEQGVIASAGLDVFEDEPRVPERLIALEHVALVPHVGSASEHTRRLMGQLVVDNLVSFFEKGRALTPTPETEKVAATT